MKITRVLLSESEVREAFKLSSDCDFDIDWVQGDEPVEGQESEIQKSSQSIGDKERAREMIAEGKKPKEIAEATGLTVATVYSIKYGMKKEKAESSPEPQEDMSDLKGDEWYAQEIKRLWSGTDAYSKEVCSALGISIMRFNRIITDYQISKV